MLQLTFSHLLYMVLGKNQKDKINLNRFAKKEQSPVRFSQMPIFSINNSGTILRKMVKNLRNL